MSTRLAPIPAVAEEALRILVGAAPDVMHAAHSEGPELRGDGPPEVDVRTRIPIVHDRLPMRHRRELLGYVFAHLEGLEADVGTDRGE